MGSCFSSEEDRSCPLSGRTSPSSRTDAVPGRGSDANQASKTGMNQLVVPPESRQPPVSRANGMPQHSTDEGTANDRDARQKSFAPRQGNNRNSMPNGTNGKFSPPGSGQNCMSAPQKDEVKILLLGSGESGKSTILKQMKIIHQNGYSQEELLMYKTTVYKNLLDCAKAVVGALDKFGLTVDSANNIKTGVAITTDEATAVDDANAILTSSEDSITAVSPIGSQSYILPLSRADLDIITTSIISPDPDTVMDPNLANSISLLWAHPMVKKILLERRSEFYIMDSAPYFFNNVRRISDPDYIPSVNDILRARIKTTGIYETRFEMGGLNIHMYDVGGQRSERKKWIHCFDNVTLIIFCVALSEYDQVLLEETNQNRLAESLVLFDSVINSRWFKRTSVVLFLNKIDVFTEKLPHSPLENYFEDYTGGNDINKAAKYILWRFTQTNRAGLNIYPHLTQATDTSNIRLVFAAVKETILQNSLRDSGIL